MLVFSALLLGWVPIPSQTPPFMPHAIHAVFCIAVGILSGRGALCSPSTLSHDRLGLHELPPPHPAEPYPRGVISPSWYQLYECDRVTTIVNMVKPPLMPSLLSFCPDRGC